MEPATFANYCALAVAAHRRGSAGDPRITFMMRSEQVRGFLVSRVGLTAHQAQILTGVELEALRWFHCDTRTFADCFRVFDNGARFSGGFPAAENVV